MTMLEVRPQADVSLVEVELSRDPRERLAALLRARVVAGLSVI